MSFIYLASPYSHKEPKVMQARYHTACAAAATLMVRGHKIFAPIPHSHPISEHMPQGYGTDFEFWMGQDLPILRYAKELWVLTLDGWAISRGVTRERAFAGSLDIPVKFIDPLTLEVTQ